MCGLSREAVGRGRPRHSRKASSEAPLRVLTITGLVDVLPRCFFAPGPQRWLGSTSSVVLQICSPPCQSGMDVRGPGPWPSVSDRTFVLCHRVGRASGRYPGSLVGTSHKVSSLLDSQGEPRYESV